MNTMKKDNKSLTALLRQKAEEFLKKKSLGLRQNKKDKRISESNENPEASTHLEPVSTLIHNLSNHQPINLSTHKPVKPSTYQPINLSETDTLKLINELQVYHVELEIQNEELRQARSEAQDAIDLYDLAPSGYFTINTNGEIIRLNLTGSYMLGKDRRSLQNSRFGFFVSEDTKPIFNLFLDRVFRGKTKESCEVKLITNGNEPMIVLITGIVNNKKDQCLVTIVDITEQKQALELARMSEQEIKLKNEELRKINAEKDKFFSIIAHDLRSPFTGFLGLTQIMAEDITSLTTDEIHKIAVNMRDSTANLFRLIENLLHWARIQQGLIPFNPETLQLFSIIDESIAMVMEHSNNKEIDLVYDIPGDLEVYADSNILQTVIRNIVSNAVKFTHKGGKISVSAKPSYGKMIEISVKDSGIGMSCSMIDHLFRLDVQANRKGTEGETSTGLGLLLCKEFVEKLGGKIWVESEEGHGSDFKFTLPLNPQGFENLEGLLVFKGGTTTLRSGIIF